MESIIQPYNVHRGRFYDAPFLNHFNIEDFISELNGRNGIVPIFLDMGCCLWVRVRFIGNSEPEVLSLFMHSDAYGQYGESTSDMPRLNAFKEGYIEYNPNSFSNFIGYNNVSNNTNDNANTTNTNNTMNNTTNNNNIVQNIGRTNIGTGIGSVGSVGSVGPISDNIVNNITNNNVNNINNNIDNNNINNTIIINDNDEDEIINYFDYDDDPELNDLINDIVDNIESDDETLPLDNVNVHNNNADNDSDNDYISSDDEDLNDNSDDVRQPIPTIACPLCRTINAVDSEVHDIRGSSDTCVICMERNVQIFLGGCGHACMCMECYNVIREHNY
jgi:hypothetical protein